MRCYHDTNFAKEFFNKTDMQNVLSKQIPKRHFELEFSVNIVHMETANMVKSVCGIFVIDFKKED